MRSTVLSFFFVFLFGAVCSSQHIKADHSLRLAHKTPSFIVGTFSKAELPSLTFLAKPSSLTFYDEHGAFVLWSLVDYGFFIRVHLGEYTFLIQQDDSSLPRVVDVSKLVDELPGLDLSVTHSSTENIDTFRSLSAQFSPAQLQEAESRYFGLLGTAVHSPEAAALIQLSLALALEGVDSIKYPSSLPLHMTALRVSKLRTDVFINPALIDLANVRKLNVSSSAIAGGPTAGCEITTTCNNACFGMCGNGCNCWSWVCGDCECWRGCEQHDCCCSCRGMSTACCLNVISVRCNGYNNNCVP